MEYDGLIPNVARTLQEDFELTDYEALKIAVEVRRNEILKYAFTVNFKDPSALEYIGMQLCDMKGIVDLFSQDLYTVPGESESD